MKHKYVILFLFSLLVFNVFGQIHPKCSIDVINIPAKFNFNFMDTPDSCRIDYLDKSGSLPAFNMFEYFRNSKVKSVSYKFNKVAGSDLSYANTVLSKNCKFLCYYNYYKDVIKNIGWSEALKLVEIQVVDLSNSSVVFNDRGGFRCHAFPYESSILFYDTNNLLHVIKQYDVVGDVVDFLTAAVLKFNKEKKHKNESYFGYGPDFLHMGNFHKQKYYDLKPESAYGEETKDKITRVNLIGDLVFINILKEHHDFHSDCYVYNIKTGLEFSSRGIILGVNENGWMAVLKKSDGGIIVNGNYVFYDEIQLYKNNGNGYKLTYLIMLDSELTSGNQNNYNIVFSNDMNYVLYCRENTIDLYKMPIEPIRNPFYQGYSTYLSTLEWAGSINDNSGVNIAGDLLSSKFSKDSKYFYVSFLSRNEKVVNIYKFPCDSLINLYFDKQLTNEKEKWLKKTEFEKTTEYESRISAENIQKYTIKATWDINEQIINKISGSLSNDILKCWDKSFYSIEYIADSEQYRIFSKVLGSGFKIKVPSTEAIEFHEAYSNNKLLFQNPHYTLTENSTFRVDYVEIIDLNNNKLYCSGDKYTMIDNSTEFGPVIKQE